MTITFFIAIILIIVALTAVFYAAHMAGTLPLRTGVAALGFTVLMIGLYLVGAFA